MYWLVPTLDCDALCWRRTRELSPSCRARQHPNSSDRLSMRKAMTSRSPTLKITFILRSMTGQVGAWPRRDLRFWDLFQHMLLTPRVCEKFMTLLSFAAGAAANEQLGLQWRPSGQASQCSRCVKFYFKGHWNAFSSTSCLWRKSWPLHCVFKLPFVKFCRQYCCVAFFKIRSEGQVWNIHCKGVRSHANHLYTLLKHAACKQTRAAQKFTASACRHVCLLCFNKCTELLRFHLPVSCCFSQTNPGTSSGCSNPLCRCHGKTDNSHRRHLSSNCLAGGLAAEDR